MVGEGQGGPWWGRETWERAAFLDRAGVRAAWCLQELLGGSAEEADRPAHGVPRASPWEKYFRTLDSPEDLLVLPCKTPNLSVSLSLNLTLSTSVPSPDSPHRPCKGRHPGGSRDPRDHCGPLMDSKGRRQALTSASVTLMDLTLLPVEAEEGKATFRKCLPSSQSGAFDLRLFRFNFRLATGWLPFPLFLAGF